MWAQIIAWFVLIKLHALYIIVRGPEHVNVNNPQNTPKGSHGDSKIIYV
jgi:hypothetical protein